MSKRISTNFSRIAFFRTTWIGLMGAVLLLSACDAGGHAGRTISQGTTVPLKSDARVSNSTVIAGLQARKSILDANSPAGQITSSTLASNTGPGSAELRLARIKADVEAKNWLPSIGPNISLTSLSSAAASLILDVTLFDNGRKRAEREYAVADVEVAAVNLAIEASDRVRQALSYYTDLQRADMEARITSLATIKLEEFAAKSRQRVASGYSNVTERTEITQALTEMRVMSEDAEQSAAQARSQLAQMGVSRLPRPSSPLITLPRQMGVEPLDITLAEARSNRAIAQARIDRSEMLPSLGASVTASSSGTASSAGISGPGMGPGTVTMTTALSASQELARQKVTHARSQSAQNISGLQSEITRLEARRNGLRIRIAQAREGFELYSTQFVTGGQQLTDVVDAFTAMVRVELEMSRMGYDIDQAKLELAHAYGVLADGGSM